MKLKRLSLCLGVAFAAMQAQAGEISISGFGSVIVGAADHDLIDGPFDLPAEPAFARYYDDKPSFEPDSVLGVQFRAEINERASATVQLISEGSDEWDTKVDMAYLSYLVNDQITVRAGHLRIPFFVYSDFVNVGYAYPWITPPFEIYNSPFNNLDGVDVIYRTSFGSVDAMFQAYYGADQFVIDESFGTFANLNGRVDNEFGLIAELTWRDFKFRYAYHAADASIETPDTPEALGLTCLLQNQGTGLLPVSLADPCGATVASPFGADPGALKTIERLDYTEDYYDFHEVALQYDNGNLLAMVEWATASGHDASPTAVERGGYAMVGYRFGPVMLGYTYGYRDDKTPDVTKDLNPANPISALFIPQIESAMEPLANDSKSDTISVRWDFSPGVALKAEVIDYTDNKNENNNTVITRAGVQFVF